nr:PREDICTED: uncharacterized protein LOC108212909 [Daucus carota subsp. sativus]
MLPPSLSGNFSEIKRDEENDGETYPDLLHFPLPTKDSLTAILMTKYQNLIKEEGDDDHTGVDGSEDDEEETLLIDHWSHLQHPLILLEEIKDAHNDSDHIHDMLVCNGCTLPISNQINYYGCLGCNFFLHISCAKHLPLQLPPGRCVNDPQHSLQLYFYLKHLNATLA